MSDILLCMAALNAPERKHGMSQKVKITKVRHEGASVYLGNDKYGNERYSRNPERIIEWMCDGWRYRFNEFRAIRSTRKYVGKDSEDSPIYKDTFLGGDDPIQPGLNSESRVRSSWLRSVPSCVFEVRQSESTDWFASLKRIKTSGGKASGFKKRRDGLSFTAWSSSGAKFFQTGKKSGVVTISGRLPKQHRLDGSMWKILIKVKTSQPIRDFTSVNVNWTKKTLVFTNRPLPVERTQTGSLVGLDMGVAHTLVSSNREYVDIPRPTKSERYKMRKLQKALARKDAPYAGRGKGKSSSPSKRRAAIKEQMKKLAAKQANRRDWWIHNVSKELVVDHDFIALEDLKVKNMSRRGKGSRKRGLNRSILESSWGKFRDTLSYKAKLADVSVVLVDPRHTSQTCNKCTHVARENRESQAIFKCVSCGHLDNADVNAAKNILVRGLTSKTSATIITNNGLESSLERGGDVRPVKANSKEALICASPRKIFTSVNKLSSEAKPY